MRNAVMAGVLLMVAAAAIAQSYNAISYDLQLDAVARDAGAFASSARAAAIRSASPSPSSRLRDE